MTKPADKKAVAPKVVQTKLNLQLRQTLGDAYAFVQGERLTNSIASVTLESLINEQIDQIEGTDGKTSIRPNKIEEVDRLMNETTSAVETVKSLPPSAFTLKSGTKNANTSLEGDDKVPT